MYRIREVDSIGDNEAIEAIHQLNGQTPTFPRITEDELAIGYWWLAFFEQEPVAFAGLIATRECSETGYFKRAGVDPKHRGNGLQLRLMRARVRKARKLGFKQLVTETTDAVHSANNCIRCGFEIFQPETPWVSFKSAIFWIKAL